MKIKFIEDARGAWKLLSMHVAAAWAAAIAFVAADPTMLVTAWAAVPAELREYLPPWVRFAVIASAMLGTIYLARVVKQPVTKRGKIEELQQLADSEKCDVPPDGWICTRPKGHEGACAAIPKE